MTALFNKLYSTGHYPDQWCTGVIVPIYKKGDKKNPANYRGITLTSTMSKMFTYLLNRRLCNWCEEQSILSEAQFAYKTGYSTIDAVFVLKLLITHANKSSGVFCAFIDFSKAFDNVDRNILYKILVRYGISSKMLHIIINMYSKIQSKVKTSDGMSEVFPQCNGLMQGECLSPTLFAIYINELESIMNNIPSMGICLGDRRVPLLKYADDLVLISTTKEGLQSGLDALYIFCNSYKLSVNTTKSQVMYISRRTLQHLPGITYNNERLQWTDMFKYLGVTFSRTNRLSNGLKTVCQSAKKAQIVLDLHLIKHPSLSANHVFELFDILLKPILLYGCEVYGSTNYTCIESFHIKFMKQILNVKDSTNTSMIYAETGRYPLAIQINKCMVKYWLKVVHSDATKLINIVYMELMKNVESCEWITHIKNILSMNGFGYVWKDQGVDDEKAFLEMFEQRSKDIFIQNCHSEINNSSRCRMYKEVKLAYESEPYLNCKMNKQLRIVYTKFRLSSHKLLVERGRWMKPQLPYTERRCTLCNNGDIEDEYHITLCCAYFLDLRRKYIKSYYHQRPSMHKFVELLNTKNERTRYRLIIFIKLSLHEHLNALLI